MTNPTNESEDLLIHRAVSLIARPGDWDTLEALSELDPEVWQRMAQALRDEGSLTLALETRTAVARDVEPFKPGKSARRGLIGLLDRGFGSSAGWFAAAAIAACWFTTILQTSSATLPASHRPNASNESSGMPNPPGLVSNESHALGTPTPVSTLPDVLLSSARSPDGDGYDITVMKRTLQKVRVKDLLQLKSGQDEFGNPASLPVRFATPNSQASEEKY